MDWLTSKATTAALAITETAKQNWASNARTSTNHEPDPSADNSAAGSNRRDIMISERVLPAPSVGQNRYELCHRAFKAIRRMHHPGNRIQDTTNMVLRQLRKEADQLQS
jgi:hypothetical protein